MKKSYIFISIGLWTIVGAAIIILAIFISNGRANTMTVSSSTLLKSDEVLLGNADNITIETSRQSIHILKTSGDRIKITQYGNPDNNQEELFQVSSSAKDIHIYIDRILHLQVFNFIGEEKLVVEIPEVFKGNIEVTSSSGSIKVEDEFSFKDMNLLTSSGSIKLNNSITADTLNIKSSSGSIKLSRYVTAGDLSAMTTSGSIKSSMDVEVDGDIELNSSSGSISLDRNITAKGLYANTNSGTINMENVYVEAYALETTSGSIKINSITGEGRAQTSSGSIKLALESPKGDVFLNSSSGSIGITLEPALQFTLTAQSSSGSIHTNFNTQKNERGNHATANIGENPAVNINVKTTSGSIRIEN